MINLMEKIKERGKLGQEEMIGFVVIVVIVSIILMAFLVFSLVNSKPQTESYEVSSFLQSSMHYTTGCLIGQNYISAQDLVSACVKDQTCRNGKKACDMLNLTMQEIMDKSWYVGPDSYVKGYNLNITSSFGNVLSIGKGNVTATYKGSQETLPMTSAKITVVLTVYY